MIIQKLKYLLKNFIYIIICGIVIFLLIFKIYLPITTNHGESISVPNLIGMKIEELDKFLKDRDLRYEILEDSSYSSELPTLSVLKQNPIENMKVKENRKIYITLNSKIPPKIKMPNLINGSVKNAQLILKSYDLKLGKINYVPDMAVNAVIKMYIKGDSIAYNDIITKGSTIDLDVGDGYGNQIFETPDLLGMTLEEGVFTIIGSGLRVGKIHYQDSGFVYLSTIDDEGNEIQEKITINTGKIFKQYPENSIKIKIGQKMNLWVVSDSLNASY